MRKFAISALLLGCSWAMAGTYYVNAAGGDNARSTALAQNPETPWLTIQKGIDTAGNGDTVYVKAGNYAEGTFLLVNATQNGKAIVVEGYASTPGDLAGDVNITSSDTSRALYGDPAGTTVNLTFRNLKFVSTAPVNKPQIDPRCGGTLRFERCTIGKSDVTGNRAIDIASTLGTLNLYLKDCTLTTASWGLFTTGASCSLSRVDVENITVTPGSGSTDNAIWLAYGTIGTVRIGGTNSLRASGAGTAGLFISTTCSVSNLIVEPGATFSVLGTSAQGMVIQGNVANGWIEGATFTSGEVISTAPMVSLGRDAAHAGFVIGRLCFVDNTLSGACTSHGLLVGAAVDQAYFGNNRFRGAFDISMVDKGDANVFTGNVVYGKRPLYLKGGRRCLVEHNTFVSTDGATIQWVTESTSVSGMSWTDATKALSKSGGFTDYIWRKGDTIRLTAGGTGTHVIAYKQDDNTLVMAADINGATGDATGITGSIDEVPYDNVIRNNIVVNLDDDATDYLLYDEDGADRRTICDYNVYLAGQSNLFKAFGAVETALTGVDSMVAAWVANSPVGYANDTHSVVANPKLVNASTGDFSVKVGSPALNAGYPRFDLPGGSTYGPTIGAWQPRWQRTQNRDIMRGRLSD